MILYLKKHRKILQRLAVFVAIFCLEITPTWALQLRANSPAANCWRAFGAIARTYHPSGQNITYDNLPSGIEWEGLRPPNMGLSRLTSSIAVELRERGMEIVQLDREGGRITFRRGNQSYVLNVQNESFQADGLATELVSPIMRSREDRELILGLIDRLPGLGLRELPDHAGIHFHFDFHDAEAAEILVLLRAWSLIEKDILARAAVRTARASYNNPILPTVERILRDLAQGTWRPSQVDSFPTLLAYFRDEQGQASRQFSLNINAMQKHGTVEFRFMNSTTSSAEIARFHRFTGSLVAAVRRRDPALIAWLEEAARGENATMQSLAEALQVPVP